MHDNDPHITRPVTPPVVPATPVVDPTTGPVTPVALPTVTEYRNPSPYPYIAGILLLAIGLWGLFAYNNGRPDPETERVTYVEQRLEPAPSDATAARMAEDRARDELRDVRRQEFARDTARDGSVVVTSSYDNEVASVDLAESNYPATAEAAPVTTVETSDEATPTAIAVLDLDYSTRSMAALSEQELHTQLNALEDDFEQMESAAQEMGQLTGFTTLEMRREMLEDRLDNETAPLSDAAALEMTRQLTELQDEFAAFRLELEGLAAR